MHKALLVISILSSFTIYSQEKKDGDEPIIFGEFMFGGVTSFDDTGGFIYGAELNYQVRKHLFSIRYLNHIQLETEAVYLSPFTPIPIVREKLNLKEISALYGKRWIYDGTSISISGGISLNQYSATIANEEGERFKVKEDYLGFPIEFNFKWFKSKKRRYRIYGIFPVGRPTSFGRNFGFKLVGNFSKHSFIGLGFVYGFGIHKKY